MSITDKYTKRIRAELEEIIRDNPNEISASLEIVVRYTLIRRKT